VVFSVIAPVQVRFPDRAFGGTVSVGVGVGEAVADADAVGLATGLPGPLVK
jgi:hypothetical protein